MQTRNDLDQAVKKSTTEQGRRLSLLTKRQEGRRDTPLTKRQEGRGNSPLPTRKERREYKS